MTKPDENEIWRMAEIDGYEVWSAGRVRNIATGYITYGVDNGIGYRRITLRKDGRRVFIYVHRLVGAAFLPNPDCLPTINHKNLNRADNRAENLEWCSYEHNNRHWRHFGAVERGRQGVRCLTNEQAEQMRTLYKTGEYSQRALARLFRTSQRVVWGIVNRATYCFEEAA